MASTLTLGIGFVAAAYLFLSALLRFTQDPKEPPLLDTSIPFISPLLGLITGMQKYFVKLRDTYGLPIYTLRTPGQRMYVVNSLSLIPPLQRQYKTVAFAPIEAQAAATVMGVGPAGNAIIGSDKMFDDDSYLSTFVPSVHPALSPGPGLDAINSAAVRHIVDSLEELSGNGPTVIEMFSWVRRKMFQATTEAIYGPKNPFRDPALEQAWYDFEPGIMVHMFKAWPSVLARKSLHAREHLLIPALEKYFTEKSHLQGSLLVQCRYNHNTGHGLRGRDVAATEIGQMAASLTNSMASAFWMIYHVFSNPVVLADCRAEMDQLVEVKDNDLYAVDLAMVKSSCPVLLSTWQETLRYEHIGISARVVMEDTILDNKYLLKRGATVMGATPVQHSDASVWGPTVGDFDHRRFLRGPGKKRVAPVAFRSFGGGTVLCPGRHFVSTEVLSFVALLLLRFDLKPVNKHGEWVEPRKYLSMTSSMPTPRDEVQVQIVPRDNREWRMNFSESSKGVNMVAEDVDGGEH
ncbi:5-beta-cholestane-3-alpha,7-alpha-diol 12-alpha-hydroxylase [Cytospora mali]|uniref:5-beta-cholestane-3-alpha,7-alpha-diol 12-alpha-hydroxylase n=1 Tax=Cytospora mali TaxID=578113 RepID=A0A194WCX6_CYTMA|nr:5-beta-cholestane-3-alpha,7-alpha-diol 12-alpha-hydroxylase [Valsa mali]